MKEKFEAGLKKRKQVLGEDYVNESFKNANSFSQPFQEFLTETYWGGVWTREGLSAQKIIRKTLEDSGNIS